MSVTQFSIILSECNSKYHKIKTIFTLGNQEGKLKPLLPSAMSPLPCFAHVEISSFPRLIQALLIQARHWQSCLFVSQAQETKTSEFVINHYTVPVASITWANKQKQKGKGPPRKRLNAKKHSKWAGTRWQLSRRQIFIVNVASQV